MQRRYSFLIFFTFFLCRVQHNWRIVCFRGKFPIFSQHFFQITYSSLSYFGMKCNSCWRLSYCQQLEGWFVVKIVEWSHVVPKKRNLGRANPSHYFSMHFFDMFFSMHLISVYLLKNKNRAYVSRGWLP